MDFTETDYELDALKAQVGDMFGHKTLTKLPDGIDPPTYWSEDDMKTPKGLEQYEQEWQDFKKTMGVG